MSYPDVMIDIETLAGEPCTTAAIISIGAVSFDALVLGRVGDGFKANVRFTDADLLRFTIEPTTVAWWMAQSDEAKAALFDPEPISLSNALWQFHNWVLQQFEYGDDSIRRVWGVVGFDNACVRNAFKVMNKQLPWMRGDDMDYRTIRRLFDPDRNLKVQNENAKHDALADAAAQARHLQAIIQRNGAILPLLP